jgi:2-polyprenyl-3-methyl-5-hydroxy-6-metoxy-1,4-benzoquinol methylase
MARCLACNSADLTLWTTAMDAEYRSVPERFTYWRCRRCQCLSIDPCPSGRLAEIYPPNYYSFSRADASVVERIKLACDRRLLRSVLARLPGEQLSVLDVGGGTGWMLDQARLADARVTGTVVVDIDARARKQAESAGHRFIAGRVEELSGNETFDLVLMLNLIEHVQNPVAVLRAIGQRLRPGGRLLLKTPNYDSLDARLFRGSYWGGLHCPRHWVLFTPDSLRAAAVRAGLKVLQLELTQGAPFWAWSVLDALNRRGWIAVSAERPMHTHPMVPQLLAVFGAFDLLRGAFMTTSQMFAVLSAASAVSPAEPHGRQPS